MKTVDFGGSFSSPGRWVGALLGVLLLSAAQASAAGGVPGCTEVPVVFASARDCVFLKPDPLVFQIAQISPDFEMAAISDIEVADFDLDGVPDLAVAWFATDQHDAARNVRRLSIYRVVPAPITGLQLSAMLDLNLYVPDVAVPALSIFRNGTADIGTGDFDGDGDVDLAVHAFFGDELWFVENLGAGSFQPHLKFPFYFNSPGNFITPPESLSADFDGDGRDELVYIADPVLQINGQIIHFWKTEDTIANLYRVEWEGLEDPIYTQWTRGLAVADFNDDDRPDLCFTGTMNPPYESGPLLTIWYGLNVTTRQFHVHHEYPGILCSDVVAIRPVSTRNPGVILSDLDGSRLQYWAGAPGSQVDLTLQSEASGFAALAPARGMTIVAADLNGDGYLGVVTKQKRGRAGHANQVQVALYGTGSSLWTKVSPDPLDTGGFDNWNYDQILRPRNLAVGDALGNGLPEIFAAFGPSPIPGAGARPVTQLQVAVWQNSCAGDVNGDGWVGGPDLRAMHDALGTCAGAPHFNINADLNKDGCITLFDLGMLVEDLGCVARDELAPPCGAQKAGDSNCDGRINTFDLTPFARAVSGGEDAWYAWVGETDCDFTCVNDVDGNGSVDSFDIDVFIDCMLPALDLVRGR